MGEDDKNSTWKELKAKVQNNEKVQQIKGIVTDPEFKQDIKDKFNEGKGKVKEKWEEKKGDKSMKDMYNQINLF